MADQVNFMFFDLHLHNIEDNIEQFALMAKQLGYSGICVSQYFNNQQKKLREEFQKVEEKTGVRLYVSFEARNSQELARLVDMRKQFDVLLVQGGDLKLNRAACETPGVDILTHPELNRTDSGLNHVMLKAAAENGVAIEINFRNILINEGKSRSKVIANISQNVKLAKKFGALLLLSSGAVSPWEMRDPMSMMSMAAQLGLDGKEAKESLTKVPQKILQRIHERKSKQWIMPGVRVV